MPNKPEAVKVAAVESLSTQQASEDALSDHEPKRKAEHESRRPDDARKMTTKDRDDVEPKFETPDRYFRALALAEDKIQSGQAAKRKALEGLLAFKRGLASPDARITNATDAQLAQKEPKVGKAQDPARNRDSALQKRRALQLEVSNAGPEAELPRPDADSSKRGGSEDSPQDVPGSDSGDGSVDAGQ